MPTPDEIRNHGIDGSVMIHTFNGPIGRQMRPQLACPDEVPSTLSQWRQSVANNQNNIHSHEPITPLSRTTSDSSFGDAKHPEQHAIAHYTGPSPMSSPTSATESKPFQLRNGTTDLDEVYSPLSLLHEFSSVRLLPSTTCSFLRSGARFEGQQTSDKQKYEVSVELKHVDMKESFLCGYLRIKGLTDDYPELTTYFEGEMIGPKYSFQTRRREWGSSGENDYRHWTKFPAYRPIAKLAKRPDYVYKNFAEREYIFMRWKEYFLVPDHNVRQINGASFEGFYYICFHQLTGSVSGIYFHSKSERFQKLELAYVPERTFGAFEFR